MNVNAVNVNNNFTGLTLMKNHLDKLLLTDLRILIIIFACGLSTHFRLN